MKLSLSAVSLKPLLGGALLGLTALTGLTVATTSPEAVVARGFAAALESESTPPGSGLVAGTEEFWLKQKREEAVGGKVEPAAWAGHDVLRLAAGDRITITTAKGQRVLDVVSVTEGEASTRPAANGTRTVLITARDVNAPSAPVVTLTMPEPSKAAAGSPEAL